MHIVSRHSFKILVILGGLTGGLVVVSWFEGRAASSPTATVGATESVSAPPQPTPSAAPVSAERAILVTLSPRELPGFWDGGDEDRFRALQSIAGVNRHPPEVVAFLRGVARDPRAGPTLRNHVANLLAEEIPLPEGWLQQLQDAALATDETLLWRDYAVQHVAVLATKVADPAPIVTWLIGVVEHGEGAQRGTALLHAARVAAQAGVPLPATFPAMATRLAQGSQDQIDARIAALATIGEQRMRDLLPEVRALAFGETEASLIAAAIGCASLLGDNGGENWITDFLHHDNPVVRAAAEQAVARLNVVAPLASP